jgi:hypothetical protein
MKKLLTIFAMVFLTSCVFAQNGLKIKTAIPTDKGMVTNVQVRFSEFYLNSALNSQFSVFTQSADTIPVQTFIVKPVYEFQLSGIPTIQIMWDSVKAVLIRQGLNVVDL